MHIIVINGKAFKSVDKEGQIELTPLDNGAFEVKSKKIDLRTLAQNRAMHLYFKQVADALNSAGLDMKQVIKADVSWSMLSVKELMWKPIQKAIIGKDSTTKLDKKDIDLVYHNLNMVLGEKFGIYIPFPSLESLLLEQQLRIEDGTKI